MLSLPKHLYRAVGRTQAVRARCFGKLSMTGFLCLTSSLIYAQVANDNIENRRPLRAEETITSNTTGCTVQRNCVDERLTGKCIEYHNDQWFEFTPAISGTYYVNIGSQHCRDVRGVQLVVLTGTPCQPATYRVMSCTSFGTQDDIFVALPDLQAGRPYLLDVDGYLKDYCGFTLQVSGLARGVPAGPAGITPVLTKAASPYKVVRLSWKVPDSLAATRTCRVLRREQYELRSQELAQVPVAHDTYGRPQAEYAITDSLPGSGRYFYQVVAKADGPGAAAPVVIRRVELTYDGEADKLLRDSQFLPLPLAKYPPTAYLVVVVRNAATGQVLRKLPIDRRTATAHDTCLFTQDWLAAGVKRVSVDITYYPPGGAATKETLSFEL